MDKGRSADGMDDGRSAVRANGGFISPVVESALGGNPLENFSPEESGIILQIWSRRRVQELTAKEQVIQELATTGLSDRERLGRALEELSRMGAVLTRKDRRAGFDYLELPVRIEVEAEKRFSNTGTAQSDPMGVVESTTKIAPPFSRARHKGVTTEEVKAAFIKCDTAKGIAGELRCSTLTVYYHLVKIGIHGVPTDMSERVKIVEKLGEKSTSGAVKAKTHEREPVKRNQRKEAAHGAATRNKGITKEAVMAVFVGHDTSTDMAEELKCSRQAIYYHLARLGIHGIPADRAERVKTIKNLEEVLDVAAELKTPESRPAEHKAGPNAADAKRPEGKRANDRGTAKAWAYGASGPSAMVGAYASGAADFKNAFAELDSRFGRAAELAKLLRRPALEGLLGMHRKKLKTDIEAELASMAADAARAEADKEIAEASRHAALALTYATKDYVGAALFRGLVEADRERRRNKQKSK